MQTAVTRTRAPQRRSSGPGRDGASAACPRPSHHGGVPPPYPRARTPSLELAPPPPQPARAPGSRVEVKHDAQRRPHRQRAWPRVDREAPHDRSSRKRPARRRRSAPVHSPPDHPMNDCTPHQAQRMPWPRSDPRTPPQQLRATHGRRATRPPRAAPGCAHAQPPCPTPPECHRDKQRAP